MRKLQRTTIQLSTALALVLTGCHPSMLRLVPQTQAGAGGTGTNSVTRVDQVPAGYGAMSVAIRWPQPQRGVQAIPAAANAIVLTVNNRNGVPFSQPLIFNRPATTANLLATASFPVHVGTSLLVAANAYRETIATDSAIPSADRVIAQGTQDNVTITLNSTSSVALQLDPAVTVAGVGGSGALAPDPSLALQLLPSDPRGPAYWSGLLNPRFLRYDPVAKYLYFTEDPDPGRPTEGMRIVRLSLNPAPNYGLMTLIAGGSPVNTNRSPNTVNALATVFYGPTGLAVDSSNNVYVAETGTGHVDIRKVVPGGAVSTLAGSGASGQNNLVGLSASFNNPHGLAIIGTKLYVADTGNNLVRSVDMTNFSVATVAGGGSDPVVGASSSFIPAASASIPSPVSLATLGNSLYVGTSNGRVLEIDTANGNVTRTLAGVNSGSVGSSSKAYSVTLGGITGLAASGSIGNAILYLADTADKEVLWMNATDSSPVQLVAGGGSEFQSPQGLANASGGLYVCDTANNQVHLLALDASNKLLSDSIFAGNSQGYGDVGDGSPGNLDGPVAIANRSAGGFAVLDAASNRVRLLSSTGVLSTVAGLGGNGRLFRSVGANPEALHIDQIAGLSIYPTLTGSRATELYAITRDTTSDGAGEAVYRVTGLDTLAITANGIIGQTVNNTIAENVQTSVPFENMITRLSGPYPRVLNVPTSIAVSPLNKEVSFSNTGTYQMIVGWDNLHPELTYDGGSNFRNQGIDFFVGTGPNGYNVDGPGELIQISGPTACRYDAQGNLYFLSANASGATVLRKVEPTAPYRTSTLAGGGNQNIPSLDSGLPPVQATQANLGTVADFDIDSKGNIYLASGTKIYRFDPIAATVVQIYDSQTRTFTSIAYDENDLAMFFTYSGEPKIKKVYFSRVF